MRSIKRMRRLVRTLCQGAMTSAVVGSLCLAWTTIADAAVVHFWKLDDNAASTTVLATNGSNGTFTENTNANRVAGPGGKIPYALNFDGNDDVAISGVSFASGATWSFSAWVRFDSTNAQLVGNFASGLNRIYKSSDTNIRVVSSSPFQDYTVPALGTTNWHHIFVTHSAGNSVRLWVDGVESSSGAQTIAGGMAPVSIGAGNSNRIAGDLAWVKFYDTDESANVAAIYAERIAVPLLNQLQLVH